MMTERPSDLMIGRFTDLPHRTKDEFTVWGTICGRRFEEAYVSVSLPTYLNPKFQEWMRTVLMPRLIGKPVIHMDIRL